MLKKPAMDACIQIFHITEGVVTAREGKNHDSE